MKSPAHPLPASGGSYIRNPDGSLTPVEQPVEASTVETVLQEPEPETSPTAPPAAEPLKKEA